MPRARPGTPSGRAPSWTTPRRRSPGCTAPSGRVPRVGPRLGCCRSGTTGRGRAHGGRRGPEHGESDAGTAQESLSRLQAVAAGNAPEGAHDAQVAFEVSGGAPGERYLYRVAVSGDGTAERRYVDERRVSEGDVTGGTVGRELAVRVFAAARDVGLLDDAVPRLPGEPDGQIVPDSMVAVVTIRDGSAERRIAVRAADPADAAHVPPGESSELPLDMDIRLVIESVSALPPLLDALRGAEAAL